jgi:hypothetical protein
LEIARYEALLTAWSFLSDLQGWLRISHGHLLRVAFPDVDMFPVVITKYQDWDWGSDDRVPA